MKTRSNQFILKTLFIVVVVFSVYRMYDIYQVARQPSHSFISYYTASRLLAEGGDVEQFYDDAWFTAQVSNIVPDIDEYYRPNPPTTALLMLPLVQSNHIEARLLWTGFSVVCVVIAVAWIVYERKFSPLLTMVTLLIVLSYQPLYANFKYAQVYAVLFAVYTAIWATYKYCQGMLCGTLLGIVLIIKLSGYLVILLLILRRWWLALASVLGSILLVGIITLPRLGIMSWITFLDIFPDYSQRPSSAVTAYQSISGFFKHQFMYDKQWNPSPIVDLPMLATVLTAMTILGLVVVTFWLIYHTKSSELTFSALVILSVLMSPVSLDYHYAIVLLPILLLMKRVPYMNRWQLLLFLISTFLLSIDYPYQHPRYEQTLFSIIAYPKLWGGLMLFGFTLLSMRQEANRHPTPAHNSAFVEAE